MANNLFSRLKQWLTVPQPVLQNSTALKDITQNSINELKAGIAYNKKVVTLALLSMCIWATILICYCFCKDSWNTLFDIKIYPAPLWAVITGAFNETERLEKKKKLNEFIKTHIGKNRSSIQKKLADTAWEEYKNL